MKMCSSEELITHLPAVTLAARMRSGELTAVEVMGSFLSRIRRINPSVNAIVSLLPENALLEEAKSADDERAAGASLGALHGVPFAVKDLTPVAGLCFTSGSLVHASRVPEHDSIMVERLRKAGAIFIGKTNVPEFGLGSHTFNPCAQQN